MPPLPEGTRLEFDAALPIAEHHEQIAALIRDHQVVVVAGETGSGKTTQLPKICLALGHGRIVHTQPRRIAARTVAERIAEEVGQPLGDLIGYQVRFTRKAGRDTRLKVVTDGVLLAEISRDRDLRHYDTIIIDEAHERSLNIDFLLGHLKQLLPRRPDLKVIITSATIDTARFSEHFADAEGRPAPVIEVSGRTYPVEIRYQPLGEDDDQVAGICAAVEELFTEGPGDILVFLSGEREIRDAAEAVAALQLPDTEVLPLYARLSSAEQHRVFQSHTSRRVVLATNVAETSITVPGIRYVVDPGTARISRWSARTKVQRLPIEPVSQASANQRSGRCGRVAPGVAIRLYSEDDFLARPEFTEPEILRTNLASVILQMAEADLGDIASFPFVERPDGSQITDGIRLLDELGALVPGHRHRPRLTQTGHQLARLPVDPRLARMMVEAQRLDCLREVLVLVSALAIPDVRERPADKREQADALHARFHQAVVEAPAAQTDQQGRPLRHTAHTGTREQSAPVLGEGGDVIAVLRLWNHLRTARRALSGNAFRRLCRDEFLNFLRVREWEDLHAQLREITTELGWKRNGSPAATDHVLTAVLSGLLSHVGLADVRENDQPKGGGKPGQRRRRPQQEYLGARGAKFAINPGSALAKKPPPLVMAVELVETTRLWARMVAEIEAGWIEQVGAHLLKKHHSEPHWSSSSGSVMAYERVSLYGIPIIAERPVNYARINPEAAREIFIRQALVEGNWRNHHQVLTDNAAVRAEAEALEERSRRRDVMVDDQTIYDFYDRRVPHEVVSASHFDAWWRRVEDRSLLAMSLDDLIKPDVDAVDLSAFPDQWRVGEVVLPVRYVFEPGSGHDGVTVTIPVAQLNQVSAEPFSWQVPGLRHELATELIRGLPKSVRTNFVPAPNHAREALAWLAAHGENRDARLADELGRALQALTGHRIDRADWKPDQVPLHLQVSFEVSDSGRVDNKGRDFAALRQELATRVSQTLTRATQKNRVSGAKDWTMGELQPTLTVTRGSTTAVGHPALVDEQTSVGVAVFDTPATQLRNHRLGLRRLLTLTNPDPTKWVISHLSNVEKVALAHSPYASVPALLADARLKTVESLALEHLAKGGGVLSVRNESSYRGLEVAVRQAQADRMRQVVSTVAQVLTERLEVQQRLDRMSGSTVADVRAQLDNLVFDRFIQATPDPWFGHLPRYLKAMVVRLDAAGAQPDRDRQLQDQVDEVEDHYAEVCAAQPPGPLPDEVEQIGYLIEELRVSVFAQRLRTAQSVSAKRLHQAMEALTRA